MITTGLTVGLAVGIIDDTYLVNHTSTEMDRQNTCLELSKKSFLIHCEVNGLRYHWTISLVIVYEIFLI